MPDTRDRRAIDAVPCPQCGAPKGQLCKVNWLAIQQSPGRPITHTARREAYRQARDSGALGPTDMSGRGKGLA